MIKYLFLSLIMLTTVLPVYAQNQARCQCEYDDLVGDCRASVVLRDDTFTIKTDTKQCARVDWYRGIDPVTTIVTNGIEKEKWLSHPKDAGELSVDDCKICKDSLIEQNQSLTYGDRGCSQGYVQVPKKETVGGSCNCPDVTKRYGELEVTGPSNECLKSCREAQFLCIDNNCYNKVKNLAEENARKCPKFRSDMDQEEMANAGACLKRVSIEKQRLFSQCAMHDFN